MDLDRTAGIGKRLWAAAQSAGGEAAWRRFAGVGPIGPFGALFERRLHGECAREVTNSNRGVWEDARVAET